MNWFRDIDRPDDNGDDRVFLRPRPLVNPLIARWRFLERLAAINDPVRLNGSSIEFEEVSVQEDFPQSTVGRASPRRQVPPGTDDEPND